MEMICIACPNGCRLNINNNGDGTISVTGNKCPKGITFANEEILAPKRSATTTVRTKFSELPVVPVRIDGEIPKGEVEKFIKETKNIVLDKAYGFQEVVIENLLGHGVNVICSVDMGRILKNA